MPGIVIVSGAMGTGKSTLARRLAKASPRGLHLDSDLFYGFPADPIDPATPESHAQNVTMMRALARGHSVGLMNDQKFNQGIAVPFFGYDAMTAPGPTRLAMRFKVPIVPIACLRTGPGRYRVTFHAPFMPDADPDEDKAIYNTVLRINQWVEARIREAPEQWFWMHNRWPKEAWLKAGVYDT